MDINKVVDRFLGLDPIDGEHAKNELMAYGEGSLDLVIARFGKLRRTSPLTMRLGELFGQFDEVAVERLMKVLKTGDWQKMIDATYCFENLSYQPAGNLLYSNFTSPDMDIIRCSIDAMGYLGDYSNSYEILSLFRTNDDYRWDKLSYNANNAFFRIAAKASRENDVHYALGAIERFYQLAGEKEFTNLWERNWYELEVIIGRFKPVAADVIVKNWLKHSNPVFRRLGAKILGKLALKRTAKTLANYARVYRDDKETVREITHSLAQIQNAEAAASVYEIFFETDRGNSTYNNIGLYLASCLHNLKDTQLIEQIYEDLLSINDETAAHTYYSLGLLHFDEKIWAEAINSEHFLVRGEVACVYAHTRGVSAIPKLTQMERECSSDLERPLILAALISAGSTDKKPELREALVNVTVNNDLRMFRYTWKREFIVALRAVEEKNDLAVWEKVLGINSQIAWEELNRFSIKEAPKSTLVTKGAKTKPVTAKPKRIGAKRAVKRKAVKAKHVNLFISYAHEDTKLMKKLLNPHLAVIKNLHHAALSVWTDGEIKVGTKWDRKIKRQLEEAHAVLFLISNNFFASGYIKKTEIKNAFARYKSKKQIVIPIYMEEVDKMPKRFSSLQHIPGQKPLNKYKLKSAGWLEIQKGIKTLIKDIKTGNTAEYFE